MKSLSFSVNRDVPTVAALHGTLLVVLVTSDHIPFLCVDVDRLHCAFINLAILYSLSERPSSMRFKCPSYRIGLSLGRKHTEIIACLRTLALGTLSV